MNARQILDHKGHDVLSAPSNMTIGDIVSLLVERRIGAVPIVDGGKLVGMLSERDVMRGLAIRGADVLSEAAVTLMTKAVHVCALNDSVDDLLSMMTDRKIRHLPVMDGSDLVGLLSIGDVVKDKISEVERESAALKSYIASA